MESHHTTVRGVPLRWEEAGEGFPVVVLHGIPTAPALWRHVVPLVGDARSLAFEMVGYGESTPAGRERRPCSSRSVSAATASRRPGP